MDETVSGAAPAWEAPVRRRTRDASAVPTTLRERWWASHMSPALVVSDVVGVTAGSVVAVAIRPTAMVTALTIAALALLALGGLPQRPSIALSTLEQIPWLVRRIATAYLLGVPLLVLTDRSPPLGQAAIVTVTVIVARAVAHAILRRRRSRGKGLEPTLLLGDSETSRRFMRQMGSDRCFGLDFVGVIGLEPEDASSATEDDLIGHLADVPALVEGLGVRRVIVGPDVPGSPERAVALRKTLEAGARVHLLPRMSQLVPSMEPPFGELVLGHPFVELVRPVPSGVQWFVKRVVDVVVASLLLILVTPVLAVVAVGVKRSSPGPILFRQTRIGRNGVPFVMYKFRTFPVGHLDVVHSLPNHACPLRFGRFLRRTSLDELPQLLNVVRGNMSLVGPRPERPHFVVPLSEQYPEYADRHRVRGGVTGLAQTMGYVGDTPIEDRIRLDNRYIDGWSLWQDALIAGRTFVAIVRKAFH